MFVIALTRSSLTMQLLSGVDVYAHVCAVAYLKGGGAVVRPPPPFGLTVIFFG